MALVPVTASTRDCLIDLGNIGNSVEGLVKLVDSQKELCHSQIDQLQRIVVTQCKLTGANPLAQEMAAGALSIKIGKRPSDLLNPKAIKYMQSLFSIKDTIGKKETREISALCGITVTQVRDYFASQRSKVRKLVRLLQEKVTNCNASKATIASKSSTDGCSTSPNQPEPASKDAPINMSDHVIVRGLTQISGNLENITSVCTESAASPVDFNCACTHILGNSNDNTGNFGYAPFLGDSGNVTAQCAQVLGNTQNVTALCTQALGKLGNVSTLCTPVSGNLGIVPTTCAPVSGNLGNVSTVCTPDTFSGYPRPVTSVGTLVPGSLNNVTPVQNEQLITTKTNLQHTEEVPSSSAQEESTLGVDSDDKQFLENIFNLMKKEQTFSGRVKLLEWVLQICNSAILSWFSTKGGITILASWLNEAAIEEQTTVLLVIFKVLCHLPLKKVQPAQMSAILQVVNRLRFYRNSDISNRAKVLLSRWSKLFVRSQALRNSRNSLKNAQKEMLQKQRTNGVLDDKSWPSKLDIPEDILAFAKSAEDSRETDPNKSLKLLTESGDGSTRKHDRTVSAAKTKERRKVLLVEQPDGKAGRSGLVARVVPSNTSRPMSADDIQKAKLRASFMQEKYGKSNIPATENTQNSPQKAEDQKAPSASQGDKSFPANKIPQLPRRNEVKKSPVPSTKCSPSKPEISRNPKPNLAYQERLLDKLKMAQIPWRRPPEIKLNSTWRVCEGRNSKEVHVQTQRNQREKEAIYQNPQEIPPNPREPWDVEMDLDDSLTPEIPIDQPPDPESPSCSPGPGDDITDSSMVVEDLPSTSNNDVAEPDAELLVVLLKNPEVVEALTKGEGKNLSQEQLVALLDMVKKAGTGMAGVLNGVANISAPQPAPEPVSLPSPTPPSDVSRTGWRSEFSVGNNRGAPMAPPFLLPSPSNVAMPIGVDSHQAFAPMAVDNNHDPGMVLPAPQLTGAGNHPLQQHPPSLYLPHQRIRTAEALIPSNHYQVNNTGSFNPPPPPVHSEPTLFLTKTRAWPNGASDDSAKHSNYYHNQNYHNSTNNRDLYPRRNDCVPRTNMVVNPQEPYGQHYCSESRREFDRSHGWSRQRQWDHGQQRDRQHRGGGGGMRRWHDGHRDRRQG